MYRDSDTKVADVTLHPDAPDDKIAIGHGAYRRIVSRAKMTNPGDGLVGIYTPDGEGGDFNEDDFARAVADFVAPRL